MKERTKLIELLKTVPADEIELETSEVNFNELEHYTGGEFLIEAFIEPEYGVEVNAWVYIDPDKFLTEYFGSSPHEVDIVSLEDQHWRNDRDFIHRQLLDNIDEVTFEKL